MKTKSNQEHTYTISISNITLINEILIPVSLKCFNDDHRWYTYVKNQYTNFLEVKNELIN